MSKKLKILLVIILMIGNIFLISNQVFAVSGQSLVNAFNGTGGVNTADGETIITKSIGIILAVIRVVAIGIGVIMLTFLGIKYMSAAPTEKANIKTQLITFTIGIVVVVGATSVLGIIKNASTNITRVPGSDPYTVPGAGEFTDSINYDY